MAVITGGVCISQAGRDQAKKQSQLAAKAQMLQDLEATRYTSQCQSLFAGLGG